MATLSFVVPLILLLAFVRHGQSLLCWSCSTMSDLECGEPFVPEHFIVVNCEKIHLPTNSTSRPVCMTLVRVADDIVGGYITRSCTWVDANDFSSECPKFYPQDGFSCVTCDSDACNNSSVNAKTVTVVGEGTCLRGALWLFITAITTILINNL